MNGMPESILAKCICTREEEQDTDGSEVQEEKKPTGGTDDSSGALLGRVDVVVDEVPLPPTKRQCIQNAEEANAPGPPGLVVGEEEQKDEPMEDVSVAVNDFQ